MEIYPDFREFLESFAARDVRYLVVGGYALGFHGHPRYTGDLDVWIEPTPENSARVIAALTDFGFSSLELAEDTFSHPDVIVQIGREPLRIDLITSPSGVVFETCYPQRKVVDVDGISVDVIGMEGFKANKAASGRPQDIADLDHVKRNES
ncbi:MAG: nucleotidyltransferase [Bacteroidota bacterium]